MQHRRVDRGERRNYIKRLTDWLYWFLISPLPSLYIVFSDRKGIDHGYSFQTEVSFFGAVHVRLLLLFLLILSKFVFVAAKLNGIQMYNREQSDRKFKW